MNEQRLDTRDALTIREGTFNKITKVTARILDMPIVIVSVVDAERLWFVSQYGAKDEGITLDPAFCASVVMSRQPTMFNRDDNHVMNPLKITNHDLQFYAGVPIESNDGMTLGVFAVLDRRERMLTDDQLNFLKEMASIVADELELRNVMKRILALESQLLKNALEAKERAEHVANHDSLTGLSNRLHFMFQLEEELKLSHYYNACPAVYMLDLDKFKPANDTFGHQFGDAVLKEVARRIKSCISQNDIAARLGGDEFVILKRSTNNTEAEEIAKNLVESLAQPYTLDGQTAHLSSSVGFALYKNHRDNSRQMIRHADLALYYAKSKGGKTYQAYDSASINNPMIQTRHRN